MSKCLFSISCEPRKQRGVHSCINTMQTVAVSLCPCISVVCWVWWFGEQLVRYAESLLWDWAVGDKTPLCVYVREGTSVYVSPFGPMSLLVVSLSPPQTRGQWQEFLLIAFSLAPKPLCHRQHIFDHKDHKDNKWSATSLISLSHYLISKGCFSQLVNQTDFFWWLMLQLL